MTDEEKKAKRRAYSRAWQLANPERVRSYYHANKEKYAPIYKRWKADNRDKINAYAREYSRRRYATDPNWRMMILLRRHSTRLGENRGGRGTLRYLGCTIAEARSHIESQWLPGMSWDNHSRDGWHIDHIVPLSSFNLLDEDQAMKALHYTNLRPLWAIDNLTSGARLSRPRRKRNPVAQL